jgi:hypothetical protein
MGAGADYAKTLSEARLLLRRSDGTGGQTRKRREATKPKINAANRNNKPQTKKNKKQKTKKTT